MGEHLLPALAPLAVRLQSQFPTCEVLFLGFSSNGVRITIDHPDGVSVQLTSRIARALRPLIPGWGLEVSSPGPKRPLLHTAHFHRAVGRRIRLQTGNGVEYGKIISANSTGITFLVEGGSSRFVMYEDVIHTRQAKK